MDIFSICNRHGTLDISPSFSSWLIHIHTSDCNTRRPPPSIYITLSNRQTKESHVFVFFLLFLHPPRSVCTLHVSFSNVNSLFGYSLSAGTLWDLKPNPRLLWPFFYLPSLRLAFCSSRYYSGLEAGDYIAAAFIILVLFCIDFLLRRLKKSRSGNFNINVNSKSHSAAGMSSITLGSR